MNKLHVAFVALAVAQSAVVAVAQEPTPPAKPEAFQFHGQATFIPQAVAPFHSPYAGPNSLLSNRQVAASQTYTLYMGVRLSPRLEAYVNTEMARGSGLSDALGLAGFTNGEVIRNPFIGQDMVVARTFARYTVPLGAAPEEEAVEDDENQLAGAHLPKRRLVLTAGKLGTNDIFDRNRYANSARTQFMNWDLLNSAAYDYAADTRGYSIGVAAEYVQPTYTVRLGSFQMPVVANGINLDGDLGRAHGDQLEVEIHPQLLKGKEASVLRILGYHNEARMGLYREALTVAAQSGGTPNIVADDQPGRTKVGLSASFEQPLADGGDTGLFARAAWNDGRTESFVYTEADASASVGLQVSGKRWRRPQDVFAIALAANGLSKAHRDYLAAGGVGFILGDGKLNAGSENLVETYYNLALNRVATFGLDLQVIQNPGYNRDRGPVTVLSARFHLEF